ncbi:MAG: DUF302 domain-containing protein, partial [Betaproteobacteria bacterium]
PVNPPVNPRAIVVEDVSRADFATTLKGLQEQLTKDGWNIVAEINLGERLAKKGVQIPGGLVILELTSGKYTVPLLKKDETRYVSALMPCSVSVYGMSDGRVIISRINAGMMAGMLEPQLADAMKKAAAQLDESIARALAAK